MMRAQVSCLPRGKGIRIMSNRSVRALLALVSLSGLVAVPAYATNGYFSHGYGNRQKGMAGVGIALAQDALAPATNPAGLVDVGNRYDVGIDWFAPRRGGKISGNSLPPGSNVLTGSCPVLNTCTVQSASADGDYDGNATPNFLIPEFGYARQASDHLSLGFALFGNGGLNTDYDRNPFAAYGSTGTAGVDLSQLFVTVTAAYRLGEANAFGVSPIFVYQRFKAKGLGAFAATGFPGPYSESPGNVTDKGYDNSTGVGVRLGWQGELFKGFKLGATWQPKIHMKHFDKYKGLFANQGNFDIPETFGFGASWRLVETFTVAMDLQRILYSGVPSVGNSLAPFVAGKKLGSTGGPGFGWRDMTVYKFGAEYQVLQSLELRAGYSYGRQPVPASQTLFNILAPGVIQRHLTAGLSWSVTPVSEINLYYMHGFNQVVKGHGSIPAASGLNILPPQNFGGGEADIHLMENVVGIAFGHHF
jgi:long-chain fatty acid transport protein